MLSCSKLSFISWSLKLAKADIHLIFIGAFSQLIEELQKQHWDVLVVLKNSSFFLYTV